MTMLPGRYYVGDPCYALSDERYSQFLELIGCSVNGSTAQELLHGSVLDGEFNFPDGPRFAVFNTLWGDGMYDGSDGREYMVDAGCIAAIPWDVVDPEKLKGNGLEDWEPQELGLDSAGDQQPYRWEAKSDCNRRTGEGTLTFDWIRIDTGDRPDEDEED